MSDRVVTLSIESDSIKLLITEGKRIKKWASLPLSPGVVKDGLILDPQLISGKIKALFKAQKVKAKKVVASLSGLHCLHRFLELPKLPRNLLSEAVKREAERVMPVPVDQLYLVWQSLPAPKGETRIFLLGVPRNTVDAKIQCLRQAGIEPYLLDLKSLALARAINQKEGIVVDLQSDSFDIILLQEGIPRLMRSQPLPEGISSQAKGSYLREELKKTIEFYNSSHPDKLFDHGMPLFLTGELAEDKEIAKVIVDGLDYSLQPLTSPFKCPKGFSPTQYMVNIGLALKALPPNESPLKSSPKLLVNLNVLPRIYQPEPRSLARILFVPLIVFSIALFIPLTMQIVEMRSETLSIRNELASATRDLQARSADLKAIAELEKNIEETNTSYVTTQKILENFEQERTRLNSELLTIVTTATAKVKLNTINYSSSVFTINGTVTTKEEALGYAQRLQDTDKFSSVIIAALEEKEKEVNLTLKLKSK